MITGQVGIKPEEKTGDPFILTRKKPCGPFSFLNIKNHEYDEAAPAPVHLPISDLNFQKDYSVESCLSGFKINKTGELVVIDEDV